MTLRNNSARLMLCAVAGTLLLILLLLLLRGCSGSDINLEAPVIAIPQTAVTSIGPDEDSQQAIMEELNRQAENSRITLSINTEPVFVSGTSKGSLWIKNDAANRDAQIVEIVRNDTGDLIYTSDQMDRLFVDESDNYKNLFLYTKMRNVAGLSTSDAQKSSDMFAKCRYMDELTGSRGVVFATGTPVSNSMTELYTIQRYLQYDRLQELGMGHFDCWASRFGENASALELAPEGTGYRMRTRFAKFFNLPELMNLFKEVADIKTADQLHLPTPEVEYHTYSHQRTDTKNTPKQSSNYKEPER